MNTAHPALSSVLVLPSNITFGSRPLVVQFLKGVFELKPSFSTARSGMLRLYYNTLKRWAQDLSLI